MTEYRDSVIRTQAQEGLIRSPWRTAISPIKDVHIVAYTLPIRARETNTGEVIIDSAPGGVATALRSVDITSWTGTLGIPYRPGLEKLIEAQSKLFKGGRTRLNLARETAEERIGHYEQTSNSYTWQGMHEETDIWDLSAGRRGWVYYDRGNAQLGDQIVKNTPPGSFIWVHDYQAYLVAEKVLQLRGATAQPDNLGFFQHIPWARLRYFAQFPHREQIIDAILRFNTVGFHTKGYVDNFIQAVGEFDGDAQIEHTPDGIVIRKGGHSTKVIVDPIGIDPDEYADKIGSQEWKDQVSKLRQELNIPNETELMIDAGRIDHTKGLLESIESLYILYEEHPELIGKLSLLLVAQRSRDKIPAYQQLIEKFETAVKEINRKVGRPDWQPIYYVPGLPREQLIAAISEAKIAKITPTIDGMNLVAFEAAAYMRRGVLVLSRFAGAATILGKNSRLVDPRNTQEVARTLYEVYNMKPQEAQEMLSGLRVDVHNTTASKWVNTFLTASAT